MTEMEPKSRRSVRSFFSAGQEPDGTRDALAARTGKSLYHAWGTALYVFEHEVWKGAPDRPGSIGGPIAGAHAAVVTQGHLTQRLTATRLVGLGLFALAAPKKSGNQQVLLHVTSPAFEFTYTLAGDVGPLQMRSLNQAAELINNRSRKLSPAASASPPALGNSSTADELSKLAVLHAEGVLTDEEFAATKKALLGI